jgi:4-hydroxy-tetrahydrodipicolinate reductase
MSAHSLPARTRVVLIGASGRMGQAILCAAPHYPGLCIVAAIASPASPALGRDSGTEAGGAPNQVPVTSDLAAALGSAEVVVDFSNAAVTPAHLAACVAARRPLLLGTTGYAATLEAEFAAAARQIALLVAPNTSLGVTLLAELVRRAAAALPSFTAAIEETHHVAKRDTPSGTALSLAAAVRAGHGDAGGATEVPITSHRAGETIGEHTVTLSGPGEVVFLGHRALERGVFARGALAAALWLAPRAPGRYAMGDLLDGKTVT